MDASRGSSSAVFPMPQQTTIPLRPPSPSSLSLSSSSSYSHRAPSSITSFPILVLTVLGILTTSVLLLAYYVFVIRCCLNWHHHRGTSSSSSSGAGGLASRRGRRHRTGTSLPVSAAGAPAEARGLEEAAIQALPAFRYTRKKAAVTSSNAAPASECAVCLGEFEDEERVRMLPACLHVFHVACIDTWLQGNANCPLCRADIAAHCCLMLEPDHQLRRPQDQDGEEAIQLVVLVPGAELEADEATRAHQREAAAESAGEAATDNHQVVVGEKRKSSSIVVGAWHEIDISSREDECTTGRKDGDVLPFSTDTMADGDGDLRLQIQNILQRRDQLDSDSTTTTSSSSSVFCVV